MGLDMYLSRRIFIGAQYEHNEVAGTIDLSITGKKFTIHLNKVSEIIEHVHSWRKANAIHKWFVDNVQNGEDDCREYAVGRKQLQELLTILKIVDEDNTKAEELLPTASGFFFGSTDIDGYYFLMIKETIEMLERELADDRGEFYYQSSW